MYEGQSGKCSLKTLYAAPSLPLVFIRGRTRMQFRLGAIVRNLLEVQEGRDSTFMECLREPAQLGGGQSRGCALPRPLAGRMTLGKLFHSQSLRSR